MDNELDDFVFNDLDDEAYEIMWAEEADAYAKFEQDTIYHDNGVEIMACAAYQNYIIETSQYFMYWYPGGGHIMVFRANAMWFETRKDFDMSYFATLKGENWDIEWSSAEHVNSQIEKLHAENRNEP